MTTTPDKQIPIVVACSSERAVTEAMEAFNDKKIVQVVFAPTLKALKESIPDPRMFQCFGFAIEPANVREYGAYLNHNGGEPPIVWPPQRTDDAKAAIRKAASGASEGNPAAKQIEEQNAAKEKAAEAAAAAAATKEAEAAEKRSKDAATAKVAADLEATQRRKKKADDRAKQEAEEAAAKRSAEAGAIQRAALAAEADREAAERAEKIAAAARRTETAKRRAAEATEEHERAEAEAAALFAEAPAVHQPSTIVSHTYSNGSLSIEFFVKTITRTKEQSYHRSTLGDDPPMSKVEMESYLRMKSGTKAKNKKDKKPPTKSNLAFVVEKVPTDDDDDSEDTDSSSDSDESDDETAIIGGSATPKRKKTKQADPATVPRRTDGKPGGKFPKEVTELLKSDEAGKRVIGTPKDPIVNEFIAETIQSYLQCPRMSGCFEFLPEKSIGEQMSKDYRRRAAEVSKKVAALLKAGSMKKRHVERLSPTQKARLHEFLKWHLALFKTMDHIQSKQSDLSEWQDLTHKAFEGQGGVNLQKQMAMSAVSFKYGKHQRDRDDSDSERETSRRKRKPIEVQANFSEAIEREVRAQIARSAATAPRAQPTNPPAYTPRAQHQSAIILPCAFAPRHRFHDHNSSSEIRACYYLSGSLRSLRLPL